MKKKILTIGFLILFSYGMIGIGMQQATAETYPPEISLLAPLEASINLDATNAEWDSYYQGYIGITEHMDDSSSVTTESADTINITINFAHNSTHLHVYAFVPEDYGVVNGLLLHFFGKPGVDDGIQMDAVYNTVLDVAWPDAEVNEPPKPDDEVGGSQDAAAHTYKHITVGTYFEGTKLINSGDTAGKDIALAWGDAIAVEVLAWVGTQPGSEGPNWGSINQDGFRYIRLDIGTNQGDELDISTPDSSVMTGYVAGELYEAEYITTPIVIDGNGSDAVWADVLEYTFHVYEYEYSTGVWYPGDSIEGGIKVFHDGTNFYMLIKINDATVDVKDGTMLIVGKNEDMLNVTDATDFISIGGYGYSDQLITPIAGTGPQADEDVGGVNDGEGNQSYTAGYRYVEFSKPMASGDTNGKDSDYAAGDSMYISYLFSQSSDGGPTHFHLRDDGAGNPVFIVNQVKFLAEGEEPGGDGNTFALGFSSVDIFIILAALSPVVLVIYKRKKK